MNQHPIVLCFDTYAQAKDAHRQVCESNGVERAHFAQGRLRLDMKDGTCLMFVSDAKTHPPRGLWCTCFPR